MTLESLLETDLWHEFQKEARAEKRSTTDVLAELIEEYLETREDAEMHALWRVRRGKADTPKEMPSILCARLEP